MCQLDWATGYPTQTTGQIASWVCQWGCFGMRLTFRSADWGQQRALCVRQGSPEKQKLHWLEGLWRLRNPKIWSPVQEQDKNHVPDSYPFFFLPCQSDQEKPPREWGNQVDKLIHSAISYIPARCWEQETSHPDLRQCTQPRKRVSALKRRLWAPTGFTSSSTSKNHFTLWLTATFGRFHPVSACFLVLNMACEESSNCKSEQKAEWKQVAYVLVCLWLVSDEAEKLLTALVPPIPWASLLLHKLQEKEHL